MQPLRTPRLSATGNLSDHPATVGARDAGLIFEGAACDTAWHETLAALTILIMAGVPLDRFVQSAVTYNLKADADEALSPRSALYHAAYWRGWIGRLEPDLRRRQASGQGQDLGQKPHGVQTETVST
jgi:hypothetical protein